jgi:hypothetical protein
MTWKDIIKQDEQSRIAAFRNHLEKNPFLKRKHKEEGNALIPQLQQAIGTPQFEQLASSITWHKI